ncbi:hypothetical protein LTR36_009106 [Oleoguttula mirabilis]|uniref:Uncharacterized protein n=1 Tax=Oleoguttula mirabilis TaxID=1507867 RepID=A0AAV9J6K9_9PEZI|nr:hypothetical protein LTR36_009106 [Oleoguttula mirabilis]
MSSVGSKRGPRHITATQAFTAYTEGSMPVTTANLHRYTSSMATVAYAYYGPAEVGGIRSAARSIGFELPLQAEREILQRYQQPTSMQRFSQSNPDHTIRDVLPTEWRTLTEQYPLAADIEAETVAISERRRWQRVEVPCALACRGGSSGG